MKIDVAGEKYKIVFLKKANKYMIDNDCRGYCDRSLKKIYVNDSESKKWRKEILSHELVHAWLYEIGSQELDNEKDVETISRAVIKISDMIAKIEKAHRYPAHMSGLYYTLYYTID